MDTLDPIGHDHLRTSKREGVGWWPSCLLYLMIMKFCTGMNLELLHTMETEQIDSAEIWYSGVFWSATCDFR